MKKLIGLIVVALALGFVPGASAITLHVHKTVDVVGGVEVRKQIGIARIAPPDSDEDGVADKDDSCPHNAGSQADGCDPPVPDVSYDTTSTTTYDTYETTTETTTDVSGTSAPVDIMCESGGDYSINTGNGYYGAYQFDSQTWDAYGDPTYGEANEAPPAVQDAAAANVPYDAWPNC